MRSFVPAGLNLSSNISNRFFKALQITKKKKETIAHALQTKQIHLLTLHQDFNLPCQNSKNR
jgi:hypothetical protein